VNCLVGKGEVCDKVVVAVVVVFRGRDRDGCVEKALLAGQCVEALFKRRNGSLQTA
jgi:hypothetical protein